MAGKRGRSGAAKQTIYSRAYRISLRSADRDLLPFFQSLERLPPEQRNTALLAAVRGGQGAATRELTQTESRKASAAIDALLDAFE